MLTHLGLEMPQRPIVIGWVWDFSPFQPLLTYLQIDTKKQMTIKLHLKLDTFFQWNAFGILDIKVPFISFQASMC